MVQGGDLPLGSSHKRPWTRVEDEREVSAKPRRGLGCLEIFAASVSISSWRTALREIPRRLASRRNTASSSLPAELVVLCFLAR